MILGNFRFLPKKLLDVADLPMEISANSSRVPILPPPSAYPAAPRPPEVVPARECADLQPLFIRIVNRCKTIFFQYFTYIDLLTIFFFYCKCAQNITSVQPPAPPIRPPTV
jgi:hypothetical protein